MERINFMNDQQDNVPSLYKEQGITKRLYEKQLLASQLRKRGIKVAPVSGHDSDKYIRTGDIVCQKR